MIALGLLGLLLGYAGASTAIKVKQDVEMNSIRQEVGLDTKPVLERVRMTGVWN